MSEVGKSRLFLAASESREIDLRGPPFRYSLFCSRQFLVLALLKCIEGLFVFSIFFKQLQVLSPKVKCIVLLSLETSGEGSKKT